jgi:hypothetical protein
MQTQHISGNSGNRSRQRGSALLIVLGLLFLMGLATAMMAAVTGQSAYRVKKTLWLSSSLAIAEAGVADVIDIMNTNYLAGVGITNSQAFGGGEYTVKTERDASTGNILISSTGTFMGETRTTCLELLGDKYAMWSALAAQCAMIADGNIIVESASPIIVGRIHANGDILSSSGAVDIDGDLTANGIIQIVPKAGFKAVPGHPKVSVPSYLPLDPWREMAQSGGLYYEGNQKWHRVTLTPANGVIYVNGDVDIMNQSILNGTLVASGSITINNQFTQTQFTPTWPTLLAGVDLNLLNRGRYVGAAFAGNNITTLNNKVIRGQLLAMNNIYIKNEAQVLPPTYAPDWTPNDDVPDPDIVVGGWLK